MYGDEDPDADSNETDPASELAAPVKPKRRGGKKKEAAKADKEETEFKSPEYVPDRMFYLFYNACMLTIT